MVVPDSLRQRLTETRCLRALEVHSPLSAIIAECVTDDTGTSSRYFDALWSCSVCDSTFLGQPDIEVLNFRNRIATIRDILEVATLPLIVDGDMGGPREHFTINVRFLEHSVAAAVIVEDMVGLKQNSLFGKRSGQQQDSIEAFCDKIRAGKDSQRGDEFMIILHKSAPFAKLEASSFKLVIYANQMIRSSYLAMKKVAHTILNHGRAAEAEPLCVPLDELLNGLSSRKVS